MFLGKIYATIVILTGFKFIFFQSLVHNFMYFIGHIYFNLSSKIT